jgi:hypothetical protein
LRNCKWDMRGAGLSPKGLQKLLNNQQVLSSEIRALDLAGATALSESIKDSAARATHSAGIAGSAAAPPPPPFSLPSPSFVLLSYLPSSSCLRSLPLSQALSVHRFPSFRLSALQYSPHLYLLRALRQVTVAAQPLVEALQRLEAKLAAMEAEQRAIAAEQRAIAAKLDGQCCVVM